MERAVTFDSDGVRIAGVLFEPEGAAERASPAVVMCQGMIGVKEYFWFPTIARRLADLGYVALIWDYRGVGESEGEPGRLYPLEQSDDIRNALTFLETNPLVDPGRLALLGFSFGAGMVPWVAGIDGRVKCAVSVAGWGDGRRWMRSVRRQGEWLDLLARIEADRKARVLGAPSELMGPMGGILVGDPTTVARRAEIVADIPGMERQVATDYSLATAERLLEFRPVEVVGRISPRAILFIAAEFDAVTPADDVVDMYEAAGEPKKLWLIPGAGHYDVYRDDLREWIFDLSLAWMREHMPAG